MYYYIFLGVSASPPASGSKSAAGRRVAAKLQKELPPVAFLQQRPHRLPSLRAFHLNASLGEMATALRCCTICVIKTFNHFGMIDARTIEFV